MKIVKATKLKRGDKISISARKYTITMLTHHFGGKRDRVSIHLHCAGDDQFTTLSVPATDSFAIYRKK